MKTFAKTSPYNGISAQVSQALQQHLGPTKYGLWFDNSAKIGIHNDTLRVSVPTKFHADWISRNFRNDLAQVASNTTGQLLDIHVEVNPEDFCETAKIKNNNTDKQNNYHELNIDDPDSNKTNQEPVTKSYPDLSTATNSTYSYNSHEHQHQYNNTNKIKSIYDERYDLNRYVVGSSNILGYRAALQMTEPESYAGSLFIHGGCGLGKTHLLQGSCRQFQHHFPKAKIRYVTGEQFTNEYIYAIRNNQLDSFRKKYRQLDMLAIDDIHFLSNKKATQNEFLCTFDAIGHSNARIILASDEHPKQVKLFHQRLISRFLSGMVVELLIPDYEMRIELITILAKRRNLKILNSAIKILAQHPFTSIREIEGALTKLQALNTLPTSYSNNIHSNSSNDIGIILIKKLFNDYTSQQKVPVRISNITKVVSDKFCIDTAQLFSGSRQSQVVLARSIISYLARKLTTHSLPEIASALGRKNHSTIIAAIKRVTRDIEADKPVITSPENASISIGCLIDSLTNTLLTSVSRIQN